jgi:SPP1 family phage portal protein
MELQEILDLIGTPKELVEKIKGTKDADFASNYEIIVKQFNTKDHSVFSPTLRPDKDGPNGTMIKVARIPVPFQKQIVNRAAAFLCGNPIEIDAKAEDATLEAKFIEVIKKTWDDNKLDYDSKTLAKLMMSETEVAELWFFEDANDNYWKGTPNEKPSVKLRMRMKILANKFSDSLYPVFNAFGDMVAFARGYTIKDGKDKIEHLDIYTNDFRYLCTMEKTGWVVVKEAEPSKKIPVIYYAQENCEWVDVQWLIERIEFLLSKLADTNDYFGSPTLLLETENEDDVTWAKKDDSGKAAILKNGAKASYLVFPGAAESIKMELLNLRSLIMDMTDTPDISFDQVKGLGSYSGVALKMIFLGAHMKAADKEEIFGKGIQRRLNFLKVAHAVINTDFEPAVPLSIKPRFTFYLPKDYVEEVNMLIAAMGSDKPLISQDTAVELSTLIKDKPAEKIRLQDEANKVAAETAAANKSAGGLDNLMNGKPITTKVRNIAN